MSDKLPVGIFFGIYDEDYNLVGPVPVDVRTGKTLEPVNLEPGQSLWGGGAGLPFVRLLHRP